MLNPILDRWRLAALVAAAAMLAAAHAFQTFGHMAPCELCLKQRDIYWTTGAIALAFLIAVRTPAGLQGTTGLRLKEVSCWVLALGFAIETGLALYHAGVELRWWPGPAACTGASAVTVTAADLKALLNGPVVKAPRCDQPAWVFLGVSMAGWNALAAAGLTAFSIAAAFRERAKTR